MFDTAQTNIVDLAHKRRKGALWQLPGLRRPIGAAAPSSTRFARAQT